MTVDDLNSVRLKTNKMFTVHTTLVEFKTQQSPDILDLCLIKTPAGKSHDYREVIENEMLAFSNSSVLKRVFAETFRFRDGLVWWVDITIELKLESCVFKFHRGSEDGAFEGR